MAHLLAHPIIEPLGAYYQRRVVPISEYIIDIPDDNFKDLVHDFKDLVEYLASQGIFDKSCNFLKNFGVDSRGNIVLIDLGELFFDEREIKEQIKKKPWSRPQFLLPLTPWRKEYFLEVMEEKFLKLTLCLYY